MCVRLCGCSLNIVIKWEYTFSKGRALLKKMAASRNKIAEPPSICQRAENETRTRDPNLGKVVLYQLSYFRISGISECKYKRFFLFLKIFARKFTRQKSKKLSYNPSEPVFNAKSDYLTTESYSATTPQPPPNAL